MPFIGAMGCRVEWCGWLSEADATRVRPEMSAPTAPAATPSSPASIIRNEELLLLRAEAYWATGNLAGALADVNTVRTVSGKLAPLAAIPAGAAGLDLIMYEKHMSLLFEGTRWVDMRRWGRLGQLPIDRAGQFVAKVMPIPQTECDARALALPRGCEGTL